MRKIPILFFLCIIACNSQAPTQPEKVLLVSFDGFRADYLSKTSTPNFDLLAKSGVLGEGLIPIYPTKTFPNYYAIATGLYPENNGFIANRMYDEELDLSFSMGDRDQVENPAWWKGEPIWNTVEKAGKKAGTMFWVGSEAPIQDMRPSFWKSYDGRMPNEDRIDSVISWMSLDNENEIDLGTLYFSFVDSQGHRHGAESEEVITAIQQADELMGYLISQLNKKGLAENTNLIIVSDHGMADVSPERLVVLDDYINPDYIDIIEGSPSLMMNVTEGKLDEVYSSLKRNETNFKVYKKEDIPDRFHIKNSPRTPELLMVAEIGYTINTKSFIESRDSYPSGGAHGFDNLEEEMWGLFIATGPSFNKGLMMEPFENIHIYELIAHILEVESAGTDGSLSDISEMLISF